MLKEEFTDKTLNFALDDGGDKEFGRSMNDAGETAYHLDLSKRDWYVFDDCFGTSEEKLLIQFIDKRYDDLKNKYSDVYLIRNEKHFKLYNFDDGRPLEPDFVLYLVGKEKRDTMHYQVFIEPKGSPCSRLMSGKKSFSSALKRALRLSSYLRTKNMLSGFSRSITASLRMWHLPGRLKHCWNELMVQCISSLEQVALVFITSCRTYRPHGLSSPTVSIHPHIDIFHHKQP